MKNIPQLLKLVFFTIFSFTTFSCSSSNDVTDTIPTPPKPPIVVTNEVEFWLTKGDQKTLLQKQTAVLGFGTVYNIYPNIDVDETQSFQTVDGFGFSLTGGSAEVINKLSSQKKQDLLQELFGSGANSIGISYLRISIGASDLNATPFTYDDMPTGETDLSLTNFSLTPDKANVIPLLKEILAINPNIKIMGSPWSAPLWMKDNDNFMGGSLQPQYYEVYSQYFVKFIQEMKAEGVVIDAITPQNEPLHGGNNPSMVMTAVQQANFIKNNLGPAFQTAGITTKIITYDHNCDNPQYPITILQDAAAFPFVNGSAFHLYGGDISAMSMVHNAFPTKDVYFTEQYTSSKNAFDGDLKWMVKNVIIGSMRNWSKIALQWNLANNGSFGPNTPGGCTVCKGAITVNGSESFDRNAGYYIAAHASKFVPMGSIRIASTITGNLSNVAFKTPAGKKVLLVVNDGNSSELFNIKHNGKWITTSLDAGAVGTYTW